MNRYEFVAGAAMTLAQSIGDREIVWITRAEKGSGNGFLALVDNWPSPARRGLSETVSTPVERSSDNPASSGGTWPQPAPGTRYRAALAGEPDIVSLKIREAVAQILDTHLDIDVKDIVRISEGILRYLTEEAII